MSASNEILVNHYNYENNQVNNALRYCLEHAVITADNLTEIYKKEIVNLLRRFNFDESSTIDFSNIAIVDEVLIFIFKELVSLYKYRNECNAGTTCINLINLSNCKITIKTLIEIIKITNNTFFIGIINLDVSNNDFIGIDEEYNYEVLSKLLSRNLFIDNIIHNGCLISDEDCVEMMDQIHTIEQVIKSNKINKNLRKLINNDFEGFKKEFEENIKEIIELNLEGIYLSPIILNKLLTVISNNPKILLISYHKAIKSTVFGIHENIADDLGNGLECGFIKLSIENFDKKNSFTRRLYPELCSEKLIEGIPCDDCNRWNVLIMTNACPKGISSYSCCFKNICFNKQCLFKCQNPECKKKVYHPDTPDYG